ncbi:DUF2624 domain-containing protein [Thalassobacillus sp. CUG 92003]|uniref:DUF2624 domain-containing protein n=1 Tax=Thalassobacillus sp. CUG 92003 TaxID=2736641 RepID=UPI0015E75A52|nr:DUF2624 domain-containing protein [Thalassobacillus sp. CUG 92003]
MKNKAQQIITQKLRSLTVDELLTYSKRYNVSISKKEAQHIVQALKSSKEDPFDPKERHIMLKKLASITSPETARQVNRLLHKFAKAYGVEDWLK